jgi:very-short-patch-repair endonuclease
MLLKSAHARQGESLQCKHCDGKVTRHEANFCEKVKGLKAEMGFIPYTVTEAKILRGHFGAADFFFPDYKLAVKVNGEYHFDKHARDDTGEESELRDQVKRDEEWNAACVKRGWNVWRVHYSDATAPSCVLKAILTRARENDGHAFVEYSRGFNTI